MNFKLAINNVKKSFKDYMIYFLTLTFAIAIFYGFNSIEASSLILSSKTGNIKVMIMITDIIGYISIFVAVILGGLIVYANNFLIKRRKRELGLYMSLGMSKRKISKMLVMEELIIGVIALAVGLGLGIIFSQLLGLVTQSFFNINYEEFKILFSKSAMIKTFFSFGIIFMVVILFNVIVVSKYKLIDLLTAGKKNEKIKVKNPIIAGIIFLSSIIILGIAYKIILKNGLVINDEFTQSIILGIVGTLMFFYGLTGFIVLVIQRCTRVYYKSLNIFTARQMNSKINTNFVSMAVISLMLFVTICVISVSVAFKNRQLDTITPFDVSIRASDGYLEKVLKKENFDYNIGESEKIAIRIFEENITIKDFLNDYASEEIKSDYNFQNASVPFINLTDYNNYLKLQGKKSETLKDNEVILINNFPTLDETINKYFKENSKLKIMGKEYEVVGREARTQSISTEYSPSTEFIIVGNDSWVNKARISTEFMNINLKDKDKGYKYVREFFGDKEAHVKIDDCEVYMICTDKLSVHEAQSMGTMSMLYVALYLGGIFLISSVAVLALQQLSEASDSIERYKALRKIGASERQINKSIFKQTLMYFVLPLGLAIIHSIVGVYVSNQFMIEYGKSEIFMAAITTLGFITVVYMGYFVVTYIGYKNIVKGK